MSPAAVVLTALLFATPADISDAEALRLQRIRTDVNQMVNITCGDGSCVHWNPRVRLWRFNAFGTLTRWVRDDDDEDPRGDPWTNGALVEAFPELHPKEIALRAMGRALPYLWSRWVAWIAETPQRVEAYGPALWASFVAAHSQDALLRQKLRTSPWRRPYGFGDLGWAGMTQDRVRAAVTVLRCDAVLAHAIEARRAGAALTIGEARDAWGTPLRLREVDAASGQVRLGQSGPRASLKGAAIFSAGPDREHATGDDIACSDPARVAAPGPLDPYRSVRRGRWDAAIDRAIIGVWRDSGSGERPIANPAL